MSDDDNEVPEHPALKKFNRPLEYAKYVGKSVLKGAVKGALILGALTGVIGMIGGAALFAWIPFVGPILGAMAGGGLTAALGGITAGAILGAKTGAVLGGGFGLLDAGDAVDDAEEKCKEIYSRNEMDQERRTLLAQQRKRGAMQSAQYAQAAGVAPSLGLPMGLGQDERQV